MDSNLNTTRVLESSIMDREIQHNPGVGEIIVCLLHQLSTVAHI